MSEFTTSLQNLRRALAVELKMPFARRFINGYSEVDATSTTLKIKDTSLTQKDGFWNGMWFYFPSTQETSLIRNFQTNEKAFYLEVPLANTPSAGDDYEIHEIWNGIDMRHAINQAISEGARTWFETITDETIILEEDKLKYSLTGLSRKIWVLTKLFVENRTEVLRGTAVSATAGTLVVESASVLSNITTPSDWRISIYSGTGKGQIRTLSSVASATINISANWTTTPDSTSKYALWDSTEDVNTWVPLDGYRLDAKEYPDTLILNDRLESFYGMRLWIEYITEPLELTAETDTTIVPKRFIIPFAASHLMGQRLSDVKSDKETYYAEYERYRTIADNYLTKNAPHKPDINLKSPHPSRSMNHPHGNPLGW